MRQKVKNNLDLYFSEGEEFLTAGGRELKNDLTETFCQELEDHLFDLGLLSPKNHLSGVGRSALVDILAGEIQLVWCLGYAVGASGFHPKDHSPVAIQS